MLTIGNMPATNPMTNAPPNRPNVESTESIKARHHSRLARSGRADMFGGQGVGGAAGFNISAIVSRVNEW